MVGRALRFSPGKLARWLPANTPRRLRHLTRALTWWDLAALVMVQVWLGLQVMVHQVAGSLTQTDPIINYFPVAQALLQGAGIEAFRLDVYRGPGYPLLLAVVARLTGVGLFEASKLVSIVTTVLFVGMTYLLVRWVFTPRTGLVTIFLIMAVTTFSWNSTVPSSDIPFAWMAVGSLYFMVRGERGPRWFDMAAAGLLAGLAFVMRWNGQIAPIFLAVWFVLLPPRLIDWRRRTGLAALFLLIFVLVAAPWLYANMLLHGSPMYNEAGIALDPALMPMRDSLGEGIASGIEEHGLVQFGLMIAGKFFTSFPSAIQGLNAYPIPLGWVMAGACWIVIVLGFVPLMIDLDWRKLFLLATMVLQWGAMVFFHYESRYFIPFLPLLAALPVYIFTSDLLPDIRLRLREKPIVRMFAGRGLRRLLKDRLPGWAGGEAVGISLVTLALIGVFSLSVVDVFTRTRNVHLNLTQSHAFYGDLIAFLEDEADGMLLRPVGARQWSPARYWIPAKAGIPVLPLPTNRPYTSVLPEVSFVLYDQYDFADELAAYWDHESLAELTDPLAAPPELELAYYMETPRRVLLYRVLNENVLAEITGAQIAGADVATPMARMWDGDPALVWRSEPVQAGDEVALTFALARSMPISHLWLLPTADPAAWPASLRVEVGASATSMTTVAEVTLDPLAPHVPFALVLPETVGDTVRLTLTAREPSDPETEGALLGLAEVRFSCASGCLATRMAMVVPAEDNGCGVLETASNIAIDPLTHTLNACVENRGDLPDQTTVSFYSGWSLDELVFIGTAATAEIPAGESGMARLSLWDWADAPAPGECCPVWVTCDMESRPDQFLDTYGITFAETSWVMNSEVCNPEAVTLGGFLPGGELSMTYWAEQTDGGPSAGSAWMDYDPVMAADVLSITASVEDGVVLTHLAEIYDHTRFSASLYATDNFVIIVRVRDDEGYHYLQYLRADWETFPDSYPEGRCIYHVLPPFYTSGEWYTLERDLQADYRAVTGHDFEVVEAVSVRAYGEMKLANVRLSAQR
ncbi:MAG: glycosyltransferase family 39 protein [Anaerolineae bacterium]|nr:glycosyltransferase family 39 protein [Anaerolineae bacterium]